MQDNPVVGQAETDTRLDENFVSIVVPLYNEEDNVEVLTDRVCTALTAARFHWELVLVNDGSADRTLERALAAATSRGDHIRVVALQRNFGQTAAMQAGIEYARGGIIITMDGDLQNDPTDIPRMVDELQRRDLDLLVGWRRRRQDNAIMRKLPSKIANRLIGKVTGVRIHDYGCSLKAYRGRVIRQVKLYGEMHRFIPAWVACQVPRHRIGEIAVNHHARTMGESKYGISRVYRVLLDLLSVAFFMRFRARPGHFFGSIGLSLGGLGGLMMLWLAISKFIFDEKIGDRPMLMVAILLLLASVQMITTGVLAELLSRIYFTSPGNQSYAASELTSETTSGGGWAKAVEEDSADSVSDPVSN